MVLCVLSPVSLYIRLKDFAWDATGEMFHVCKVCNISPPLCAQVSHPSEHVGDIHHRRATVAWEAGGEVFVAVFSFQVVEAGEATDE